MTISTISREKAKIHDTLPVKSSGLRILQVGNQKIGINENEPAIFVSRWSESRNQRLEYFYCYGMLMVNGSNTSDKIRLVFNKDMDTNDNFYVDMEYAEIGLSNFC